MEKQRSEPGRPVQRAATPGNYAFSSGEASDRYLLAKKELSERQRNAAELLLQGLSDAETAAHVGVDRTTIFRWRKSMAFRRELERQRKFRSERASNRLQSLVPGAFDVLQKQLASDDPKVAMRAAAILLRFASPARFGTAPPRGSEPSGETSAQDRDVEEETDPVDLEKFTEDLMAFVESPLPGYPGAMKKSSEDNPARDR